MLASTYRASARVLVGCSLFTAVSLAAPLREALAQDLAAAEALFNKGLADMQAGNFASGCPAIGESYRLDPRAGTLFTLAECEAKAGKFATAVARLEDYLRLYERMTPDQQAKQRGRNKLASDRKAELLASVPQLTLTLPKNAPKGTRVKRDDVEMGGPSIGIPLPVDPGEHVAVTWAPNGPTQEHRFKLEKGEKKTVQLAVLPVPAEAPVAAAPVASAPVAASPSGQPSTAPTTSGASSNDATSAPHTSAQRIGGYVLTSLGVVGIAGGLATGAYVLFGLKGKIEDNCDAKKVCEGDSASALHRAEKFGQISTVSFAAGGGSFVLGTILLLTDSSSKPSAPKKGSGASRWFTGAFIGPTPDGAALGVKGVW